MVDVDQYILYHHLLEKSLESLNREIRNTSEEYTRIANKDKTLQENFDSLQNFRKKLIENLKAEIHILEKQEP